MIFITFRETLNILADKFGYIESPKEIPYYPGYKCDPFGNVWNLEGKLLKQFNSNGYKQILLHDSEGKRSIKGVHQIVAMTYSSDWFEGCVVHHIDENKRNNYIGNLKCETLQEHTRYHADPTCLIEWSKTHSPHNKGKKMSPEFCEKCRQSAKHRKINLKNKRRFYGNQYRDDQGNPKISS